MNKNITKTIINNNFSNISKIKLSKNALIYRLNNGDKYVAKENKNNIIDLYNYLNSRGFDYIPNLNYCCKEYYTYKYLNDIKTPEEQKISDIIKLSALLHNKTVYYKDVSLDEIKEMYDNLKLKIDDSFTYYDNLIDKIENNKYMSPSEYMLIRNSSAVFSCLNFCKEKLDEWYKISKVKNKKRLVLIHNNLDLKHIIKSDKTTLISWDKAYRNIPIYDFIKLYKNNYNKYDFTELYNEYIKKFPLLKEEIILMFIILFIPDKLDLSGNEITSVNKVSKLCNYLYTTDKLFMEQEKKYTDKKNGKVNE